MKKHLIFISSPEEIDYVQKLTLGLGRNNKNQIILICNNTETLFRLKQLNIPAIDSQIFFPSGWKLRKTSNQVIKISKNWANNKHIKNEIIYKKYNLGKIISYSLYLHLSECQHSLLIAKNILDTIKPDTIHVSPFPTESHLKKYQTGKLNCENQALVEIAQQRNVKLCYFHLNFPEEFISAIKLSVSYFLRYTIYSLKQLKSPPLIKFRTNFFILANYYHLTNIQPFLKHLNQNHISYALFGKTDSRQHDELKKQSIQLNRISSLLPLKTAFFNLKLINFLKYLFLWNKHLRHLKDYYNLINPGLWPLIKWKFFYLYIIQFPEIIETLNFADAIFQNHPRLFLTAASADIFNKCFAISARKNKIRTIELNHGLMIYDEEAAFRCNDELAVWGPAFKTLIKNNKILITGHPSFDNPTSTSQINKLKLSGRKKYHLNLRQNVLLILAALPIASDRLISNQSEYSFLKTIFETLAATKKSWTIIFRTHPSYDANWLKHIPLPKNINLIPDFRRIPLEKAVAASDVIIANLTTSLIEGIIQNKTVLIYPFLDYSASRLKSHPLITSGTTHLFQTSRELTKLLITNHTNIRSENSIKFLKDYCSTGEKSSGAKLFGLVKEMLK